MDCRIKSKKMTGTGVRSFIITLAALLALSAMPQASLAQDSEQDQVFKARQAGQVRPLPEIRRIVVRQFQGQLIGDELDESRARAGTFVYRFTFIQTDGAVTRVEVDARSGQVLRVEGR